VSWFSRVANVFRRSTLDRAIDEEISFHIESRVEDLMSSGMSRDEAEAQAYRQFGSVSRAREASRDVKLMLPLDDLVRDARHGLRALRRAPVFSLVVILTLGLTIGANTAIFSVVNALLIKPLPYPDSHELVNLDHVAPGLNSGSVGFSVDLYFTYLDENRTLEHLGVWGNGGATIAGVGDPEQARMLMVSNGVLQAIGVQPMLGRWFTEAEHAPAADAANLPFGATVILTHAYWQRKFGGDPGVIGRTILINSRPSPVVGVMPAGFRFLNMTPEAEVILPMQLDRNQYFLGGFGIQGLARLKPGVSLAEAQADMQRMLPIWLEAWPTPPRGASRDAVANWRVAPTPEPLKNVVVGNIASTLWVLMGTIGAVLAIACANVANLMLVRADARRLEFAVRTALGAGRRRIAKVLFVESALLGAIGGGVGLALAYLGLRLLVALEPTNLPRLHEISIDPLVLAFVVVVSLMSTLLLGSIPVLKHASSSAATLGAATRGATASRERHRTRNGLVIAQVALALVLIVCSGLMLRTFAALHDIDPGFARPSDIQIARIAITPSISTEPVRYTQIQRQILDEIAAIPGVESASFATGAPMEAGRTQPNALFVQGQDYAAADTPPMRRFKWVAPGYFATIGTRFVAGRDITWSDIDAGGEVAVISEGLARELWGDPAAAVGRFIRESPPEAPGTWREITGVVQDVYEDGVHLEAPQLVYWPVLAQSFFGRPAYGTPFIAYVVRSERAGTASLIAEIRRAVRSQNADLPVFLVRSVQDLYANSLAQTSFTLVMLAIAAAMALGLGLLGIYGVMAYIVSQRRREIGIRLALGAPSVAVKRMIVRHGLGLVASGTAIGLVIALVMTRFMSSLLFGVSALDATTYLVGLAVLVGTAAVASYVPARRAAAVDPVETLKTN
jgi:putative ABC transport system permease protein